MVPTALGVGEMLANGLRQLAFRDGPDFLSLPVDDGRGHTGDTVAVRESRKRLGVDHVGEDILRIDPSHLMSQANCLGTVGSSGGDKDLQMERGAEVFQPVLRLGTEVNGCPTGKVFQIREEGTKFVASGKP